MTVKDFLNTLHCSSRENLEYRFYEYETDKSWTFNSYDELIKYKDLVNFLFDREIEYFSFDFWAFKFKCDIRLKLKDEE